MKVLKYTNLQIEAYDLKQKEAERDMKSNWMSGMEGDHQEAKRIVKESYQEDIEATLDSVLSNHERVAKVEKLN